MGERKTKISQKVNRKAILLKYEKPKEDFQEEEIVQRTKYLLISRVWRPTGFKNTIIGDINKNNFKDDIRIKFE